MENLAYVVLPISLLLLAFRTRQDLAEYEEFKKLKSTKSRQHKFREWILWSFGLFGFGSLISLAIIGKLGLITKPSADFANLVPKLATSSVVAPGEGGAFIVGVLTSALVAGVILNVVTNKGKSKKKELIIGDIEAMLPRNLAERMWAVLLSLNAGFSEELFFRLLLPILFFVVFGNAKFAVVLAVVTFGLVHWYQGKVGVLFTSVLGAGLMYAYLRTGNIFVVMALHAAIDLNSLVLQPLLRGFFRTKRA